GGSLDVRIELPHSFVIRHSSFVIAQPIAGDHFLAFAFARIRCRRLVAAVCKYDAHAAATASSSRLSSRERLWQRHLHAANLHPHSARRNQSHLRARKDRPHSSSDEYRRGQPDQVALYGFDRESLDERRARFAWFGFSSRLPIERFVLHLS